MTALLTAWTAAGSHYITAQVVVELPWVMPKADTTRDLPVGDRHGRWCSAVALVREQTEMAVCPCGKPQLHVALPSLQ